LVSLVTGQFGSQPIHNFGPQVHPKESGPQERPAGVADRPFLRGFADTSPD